MPTEGIVQIVITRKGQDVFKVTTFDRQTVVGNKYIDGKSATKLVEDELDRLEVMPGSI